MFKRLRPSTVSAASTVATAAGETSSAQHPAATQPTPDFASLIDAARLGSAEDVDRLGAELAQRALSGASDANALLAAIGREPTLVLRLDGLVRRRDYYSGYLPARHAAWADQARARFEAAEGRRDPVVLAVVSMSADGWVRERAVAAMGTRPAPELVPFLVLRTADWAQPVRERACTALALALHREPDYVRSAAPMAARLAGRSRADFALSQVNAVLPRLTDEQFTRLLTDSQPALRRLVAAQARRLRLPDLVKLALAESDPRTRDSLAETAAREALWSGRHEFLHRLAEARSADVKAIALAGLLRAGLADQAAEHLADPNAMVRATARFAARKAEIDVLERYRALLQGERVEPGAVLGLAEATVNSTAGGGVARRSIEPYLADSAPQVRAAAVTALRLLGAPVPGLIMPLLADPSPAVVRAAVAAVESAGARVEPSWLLELLTDRERAAGARRALYRLCRRQHAAVKLAAALVVVAMDDEKPAERAAGDLSLMALPSGWPSRPSTLRADMAGQVLVPDLPARVEQARALLLPEVYDALAAAVA